MEYPWWSAILQLHTLYLVTYLTLFLIRFFFITDDDTFRATREAYQEDENSQMSVRDRLERDRYDIAKGIDNCFLNLEYKVLYNLLIPI